MTLCRFAPFNTLEHCNVQRDQRFPSSARVPFWRGSEASAARSFGVPWGLLGGPWGLLGGSLGLLGAPWGVLGAVFWGPFGVLGGPWGLSR